MFIFYFVFNCKIINRHPQTFKYFSFRQDKHRCIPSSCFMKQESHLKSFLSVKFKTGSQDSVHVWTSFINYSIVDLIRKKQFM